MSPGLPETAAAWLLTYAVHSTMLLCGVWLLARARIPDALRDTLWKAALVGGVLTATAASIPGLRPVAPLALRAPAPAPPPAPVAATRAAVRRPAASRAAPPALAAPADAPAEPRWALVLVAAWAIGGALSLLRFGAAWTRFRRGLEPRRAVEEGELRAVFDRLCRDAALERPVRLTCSERVDVPVALERGEVCIPLRAMAELGPVQQRSMLAHELAHVVRGDPAWLALSGALERIFFFQPLNRVARRRLEEVSERLCDDWAVRQTGSPLALAECLATVAAWVAPGRRRLPVAGMAGTGPSPLVERVQRLLAGPAPRSAFGAGPARAAAAGVLLAAIAALAPAVSTAAGPAPRVRAQTPARVARPAPARRQAVPPPLRPEHPVAAPAAPPVAAAGSATPAPSPAPEQAAATVPVPAVVPPPPAAVETIPVAPPPVPGAAATAAADDDDAAARPCSDRNPSVILVDGGYEVRWARGGCAVTVRARAPIRFTDDRRDVTFLGPGTYLVIEERRGDRLRIVDLRPGADGAPQRLWRVDGQVIPWNEDARDFLAGILPEFLRTSEFGAG